jgi:hypothetical protein
VQGLANNTLSGSLFNRLKGAGTELAQRSDIVLPFCFAGSYFIRRATYYWFCDLLCFTICNYCFLNSRTFVPLLLDNLE